MPKQINPTQSANSYANSVQVGPIYGPNGSPVDGNGEIGAVYYFGQAPTDQNVISDNNTYNMLGGLSAPLKDFSIFVDCPGYDGGTKGRIQIDFSMSNLVYAINTIGIGNFDPTQTITMSCQVVDVVTNGTVGQMIVFGSQIIQPAPNTDNTSDT